VIEIGRTHYVGGSGGGWVDCDEIRYGPDRTLWPLEAIIGTIDASRAADTEVRGESFARYVIAILPGEAAGRDATTLIDPQRPATIGRIIHADVSIGGRGLSLVTAAGGATPRDPTWSRRGSSRTSVRDWRESKSHSTNSRRGGNDGIS
jgi:hypothetical protein